MRKKGRPSKERRPFKFGFMGERQGSALDPLKGLLKKSLKNPQNFKSILSMFFESFWRSKNLLQKVLGRRRPLPRIPINCNLKRL